MNDDASRPTGSIIAASVNATGSEPSLQDDPADQRTYENTVKDDNVPGARESTDLYFRVLGPVLAERGGEVLDIVGAQQRGALAVLLLHANRVVSAEELIDTLWEQAPPPTCRTQLQGMVSRLRRTLGEAGVREAAPIETVQPGYRLLVPPGHCDLEEFRADAASARNRAAKGDLASAVDLFRSALGRWRGPAFADVPYAAVQEVAAGLEELRLCAVEDRIDAEIALGRCRELIAELGTLVAERPLRERFRAQYMTVLARTGRTADALAVFRDARERLVEELGIEPTEGLQSLHHDILTGQLGSDDIGGALPSAPARAQVPHQLPADVTDLVGRDEPLERATELLAIHRSWPSPSSSRSAPSSAPSPCLVISGPGGVGKTAFARRLAHMIREKFPDGQLYAQLGGSGPYRRDPGAVLFRFLQVMGIPDRAVPTNLDDRASMLRDLLADRRMLLILDDVADEDQLQPLRPARDGCAVIATTRRRLADIGDVRALPLDVLDVQAGVVLLRSICGAGRVDAEVASAMEIVWLCGRLPLAIRIVGARLAARPNWTLEHMARRLADDRDRLDWLETGDLGVRTSIARTVAGLTDDQRRLLRRLGLMKATEFPAWVPSALLDQPIGTTERILDGLVEMHLVEPAGLGLTGPRYRLHDLVHLVAAELAAEEEPGERSGAVGRALDGWLDLAAIADAEFPHWYGLDPEPEPRWRAPTETRAQVNARTGAWFDEEHVALDAAVRQAADEGFAGVAWPLVQRMSTLLEMRGRYGEWVDMLGHGLRAAEQAADRAGIACMLGLLVDAEANREQLDRCRIYAEKALQAYRDLPAEPFEPCPADAPPARTHVCPPELAGREEALAIARRAGDPLTIGLAAFALIIARRHAGARHGYLALFEESRDAFRACGARLSELWALKNIGLAHVKQRRIDEATQCLMRGLTIIRDLGDAVPTAGTVGDISEMYAAQGRYAKAEDLLREHLQQARVQGHPWDEGWALSTIGRLRHIQGDQQAALNAYLDALTVWRRLGSPARIAHTLRILASISSATGAPRTAALHEAELAAYENESTSQTNEEGSLNQFEE